jgi:ADP-ribose pyrophosphatase YjhB (NUDIX family)
MTNFTIGAFVVLFDKKDRVLLCHRRDLDIWNLPGGAVESGEMPTDAAVRETREETGLKIKIKDLLGIYGKDHRDELVFVFSGKVTGGKLKKTAESDENRYFKLDKLPENTIPKHVERIRDATKENSKPIFKMQNGLSARQLLKKLRKK